MAYGVLLTWANSNGNGHDNVCVCNDDSNDCNNNDGVDCLMQLTRRETWREALQRGIVGGEHAIVDCVDCYCV